MLPITKTAYHKDIALSDIGSVSSTVRKNINDSNSLLLMDEQDIDKQVVFADSQFVELESMEDDDSFIVEDAYNDRNSDNAEDSRNLISFIDVIESKESCV